MSALIETAPTSSKLHRFTKVARDLDCTTTSLARYCEQFDIPVIELSRRRRALSEAALALLLERATKSGGAR